MSDRTRSDTVVLGAGNPIMGDDGVGIVAVERLRAGWRFEPGLELLDGGTWGMNLLPTVERAGRLLLLDAIDIGAGPGEPVELSREQIPRFLARKLSPHQIDLKEVFAVAELRGTLPPEMAAMGLQPGSVELREGLSPPLQGNVPELLRRAIRRLERWGHVAFRRAE